MKKQVKQANEKKFNLEKMEVVKFSSMRKIIGGIGGDGEVPKTTDDTTITDRVKDLVSSGWC